MKKICFLLALVEKYIITFLIICVFSGVSAQSHIQGADTSNIDTHKHSVGVNVGWLDGLSLKFNFGNNIYLQTDFGFSFHANPFFFYPRDVWRSLAICRFRCPTKFDL